jgi:hypothetical protein
MDEEDNVIVTINEDGSKEIRPINQGQNDES